MVHNYESLGDNIKRTPNIETAVLTFGRFQAPHVGHADLIKMVMTYPCACDKYIFTSSSCTSDWESKIAAKRKKTFKVQYSRFVEDPTVENLFCKNDDDDDLKVEHENPIPILNKLFYLKTMFPDSKIVNAGNYWNSIFGCMHALKQAGYQNMILIVGDDRQEALAKTFHDYNHSFQDPSEPKKRIIDYSKVREDGKYLNVVVIGKPRASTSQGTEISGTKMREAALSNDFETFKQGLGGLGNMNDDIAQHMMKTILASYPKTSKLIRESSNKRRRSGGKKGPAKVRKYKLRPEEQIPKDFI